MIIFITAVLLVANNFTTINGISLNCTYGLYSYLQVGSVYSCTPSIIYEAAVVNESVRTVYGTHQTGKGYADVYGLNLASRNLNFVPTNIEYFFPNLIALYLFNNAITSIGNRHLIPFPGLQFLSISRNNITSIDGDVLSGMDSMKSVSFSLNSVTNVGHDLNLPINGQLFFASNPCINQNADNTEAIASLKLNLSRNCPPTILQIEDSLQRRQNFLTHIDGQVQSLITTTNELDGELARLRAENASLWEMVYGLLNRISLLEDIIGSKREDNAQFLIDTLRKND